MASRRTSTWPPTNQSGRKWIQGPSFAPVRTREEEDTPHHSEAEDIQSHSEVEDGQGHKGTPSHSEVEDTQSPLKVENTGKETSPTEIRKLFHSLGFETVYLLFKEIRGHPVTEEKKVAIIYDLRSACYVSLLHIIPTAASVTLLVFNWKGYYIGDELQGPVGQDGLRFLGLQFAAKMLEFLAVASLSAILFSLLRAQLIYDSLPFGAVTAGFEFNNLSLLWSKELLPPVLQRFLPHAKRPFWLQQSLYSPYLEQPSGRQQP